MSQCFIHAYGRLLCLVLNIMLELTYVTSMLVYVCFSEPDFITFIVLFACRYSMIIDDGRVTALNVEPDGTGLSCSLSTSILSQL